MSGQLTTAGLTAVAAGGLTIVKFPWIAIGTGTATFALDMTAMGTELGSRTAVTSMNGTGGMVDALLYITNNAGVGTLTEVGLWDAETNGNLLAYKQFETALVKQATRPAIINFLMSLRNLKGTQVLTASGIEALRAGGFTTGQFPYIAVGSGQQSFKTSLVDMKTEVERVATAITLNGAVATIKGTFTTTTQDKTEFALWDAATNGNMQGYIKVTAAGGADTHKAVLTVTLANG